jgi:hypothetical protein
MKECCACQRSPCRPATAHQRTRCSPASARRVTLPASSAGDHCFLFLADAIPARRPTSHCPRRLCTSTTSFTRYQTNRPSTLTRAHTYVGIPQPVSIAPCLFLASAWPSLILLPGAHLVLSPSSSSSPHSSNVSKPANPLPSSARLRLPAMTFSSPSSP